MKWCQDKDRGRYATKVLDVRSRQRQKPLREQRCIDMHFSRERELSDRVNHIED